MATVGVRRNCHYHYRVLIRCVAVTQFGQLMLVRVVAAVVKPRFVHIRVRMDVHTLFRLVVIELDDVGLETGLIRRHFRTQQYFIIATVAAVTGVVITVVQCIVM